jgi:hypothetical protein
VQATRLTHQPKLDRVPSTGVPSCSHAPDHASIRRPPACGLRTPGEQQPFGRTGHGNIRLHHSHSAGVRIQSVTGNLRFASKVKRGTSGINPVQPPLPARGGTDR